MSDPKPNSFAYETTPLVTPNGFREYDARWRFGSEINLLGVQALGLGLGTYFHEKGVRPCVVTGHDFRSYSLSIKQALTLGLIEAGCEVHDFGLALSPVAYFAQFALQVEAVAMVTASHNENGWTGVKMGAARPLTFGPEEMVRLKEIVLSAEGVPRAGGSLVRVSDMRERYLEAVTEGKRLSRPIRVVAACGNGTAGAFAPQLELPAGHLDCDVLFDQAAPHARRCDRARAGARGQRVAGAALPDLDAHARAIHDLAELHVGALRKRRMALQVWTDLEAPLFRHGLAEDHAVRVADRDEHRLDPSTRHLEVDVVRLTVEVCRQVRGAERGPSDVDLRGDLRAVA